MQKLLVMGCGSVGRRMLLALGLESPGSPARRCPGIEKTVAATGFWPLVGLADGVRRTFGWYLNEYGEHGFEAAAG